MKTNRLIVLSNAQRTLAACMTNDAATVEELHAQLVELQGRAEAITNLAERERRDLTAAEGADHRALLEEFKAKKIQVNRLEEMQDNAAFLRQPAPGQNRPAPNMPGGGVFDNRGGRSNASGHQFINNKTGESVVAHKQGEMFNEASMTNEPLFGQLCLSAAKGDPSYLPKEFRNAAATALDTSGGFLVNPVISSRYVDLARSKSVVMAAGAQSIPMETGQVSITKIDSDPTMTWTREGASFSASKPSFGAHVLHARKLGVVIPLSVEAIEDSVNGAQMIEDSATNSMAQMTDAVALMGTGSGQPLGIVNNSSANSQTSIGLVTDYAEVRTGIRDILNANYTGDLSGLTWVNNPSIGSIYDGLVTGLTSDGSPLPRSPWVAQAREDFTTALEANGSSEYDSVIGDFSQILFGYRLGEIRVEMLPAGSVTDGTNTYNAVSDALMLMRVWVRMDVVCLRPSWFSVLSGLTTS